MSDTQVLIVGAGPTGLVLALWLTRVGVRVRIIDKAAEPGTASRALVVHARTLEFYRQLGIADDVLRRGLPFTAANLWARGRRAAHIDFGAMGKGLSPFPYLVIFPQDLHERLLIERLAEAGVRVERPTELLDFEDVQGSRVRARLRTADGREEICEAEYLAGCDGARSRVRDVLNIGFPGGTYNRMFYVADIQGTGPVINGELNLALDTADFLAVFPLAASGQSRLIGTVRTDAIAEGETLGWDDVNTDALRRLRVNVERINWFSTYRVHHRVANSFRVGRAFLLGDAGHIHSPVGGQGMNTGIGDAVNLAWKLAAVLRSRADAKILDTYEPERIAFARRLVATTDRAFTFVTSGGRLARTVRLNIAPRVLPPVFRTSTVRRFMFRTISQIAINYRGSWLSDGRAGRIEAGDRMPWIRVSAHGEADNFAPLKALDWQVHVYGHATPHTIATCERRRLALHQFAYNADADRAGLKRDALYLLRPDGYVGFAGDDDGDPARLDRYLRLRGANGGSEA